jgi:hypothetical protein
MRHRTGVVLGIAGIGVLILGAAVLRRPREALQGAAKRGPAPAHRGPGVPEAAAYPPAPAAPLPPQAAPKEVARGIEEVRVRGTYQNYRAAVASGDGGLEKALLPVVLRDREASLKFAEEDLALAKSDFDRSVAQKVIMVLRR